MSNIVVMTMVFANVSPLYRGFLNIPNITLTSAMACRVFRNTRLGITRESGNMALSLPDSTTGGDHPRTIPLVFTRSGDRTRDNDPIVETGTAQTQGLDVAIDIAESKSYAVHDYAGRRGRQTETV